MKKRQSERNRQRKRNLSAGREGGKRDVDCPIKECLERERKQIEDERNKQINIENKTT